MRRFFCRALLLLSVSLASTLVAQTGLPAPAPELKKLDMFTGEWASEGTMILGLQGHLQPNGPLLRMPNGWRGISFWSSTQTWISVRWPKAKNWRS